MTIEKRIDEILISRYGLEFTGTDGKEYVENWEWYDTPLKASILITQEHICIRRIILVDEDILDIIEKADVTECLTSKVEYIRNCKKWFMENK